MGPKLRSTMRVFELVKKVPLNKAPFNLLGTETLNLRFAQFRATEIGF